MIIKPNNWGKHKLKTKRDPDQWMTTRVSSWYKWHMGPEHHTGVRAVSVTSLNLAYEVTILMPAGPLHLYVTMTTCLHQSRCVLTRSARRHKHTRPGTHWMRAGKSANINAHWMRVSRCAMIAHGYIATSCCKYRFIIDSLPSSLRIINYDTLRQCWWSSFPTPKFRIHHFVFDTVVATGTSPSVTESWAWLQGSNTTYGNRTQAPKLNSGSTRSGNGLCRPILVSRFALIGVPSVESLLEFLWWVDSD